MRELVLPYDRKRQAAFFPSDFKTSTTWNMNSTMFFPAGMQYPPPVLSVSIIASKMENEMEVREDRYHGNLQPASQL